MSPPATAVAPCLPRFAELFEASYDQLAREPTAPHVPATGEQ